MCDNDRTLTITSKRKMNLVQTILEITEKASYCAITGQVEDIQQLIEQVDNDDSLPFDDSQSLMTILHNCLDLATHQRDESK